MKCSKNVQNMFYLQLTSQYNCISISTLKVLYNYTCPICNNSGPDAHTRKHCPFDPGEHIPGLDIYLFAINFSVFSKI